ncbi:MAG TPA: PASTA domain-containing protein [Bacteroidales bacterium]|nr:PASTA domain-containing protein [Bacteroidales bacterium]
MKRLWKFLRSKLFLINFGLAVVITVALVWLAMFILQKYTHHGQSVSVPDFVGLSIDETEKICNERDFRFVVIDSMYTDEVEKGAVVEQNPVAGFKVKEGRTVYLIVNASGDEMVTMPELEGVSLRQAQALLESYGLIAGNLKYVPDIAKNVIIRQSYKGRDIEPGTKIKKGSKIDLIIGLGLSDEKTKVPRLIGLSHKQALNQLIDMSLNLGAVIFDNSIKNRKDSLDAKVFRQSPGYDTINVVNLGSTVDIWLTRDTSLLRGVSHND